MIMLVRFTKGKDYQYHIFTDCDDRLAFLSDPIFVKAMDLDYVWESIEIDKLLAEHLFCVITQSKCDSEIHNFLKEYLDYEQA